MIRLTIVISALLLAASASAGTPLCGPLPALPPGADDLRMNEDDFSIDRARRSLAFLRDDFSKRLWGDEAVEDLSAWSGHSIGYSNSLRIAEGALLRQNALLLRAELASARESGFDNPNIASLQSRATLAADEFCAFLSKAVYAD